MGPDVTVDLVAHPIIVQHCVVYEETGTRPLACEDCQVLSTCVKLVATGEIMSVPLVAEEEQTLTLIDGIGEDVEHLADWEVWDDS